MRTPYLKPQVAESIAHELSRAGSHRPRQFDARSRDNRQPVADARRPKDRKTYSLDDPSSLPLLSTKPEGCSARERVTRADRVVVHRFP